MSESNRKGDFEFLKEKDEIERARIYIYIERERQRQKEGVESIQKPMGVSLGGIDSGAEIEREI